MSTNTDGVEAQIASLTAQLSQLKASMKMDPSATDTQLRDYRLKYEGEANIREWGAVGDGKTDDTAAIDAAIRAVVENENGGVVFVPAGTFIVKSRLAIRTQKPFVLKGHAADVSRLLWPESAQTQGIHIEPTGELSILKNNCHVSVTGLSILSAQSKQAAQNGLAIVGTAQMDAAKGKLGGRPIPRVRVTSVAIRGGWEQGLLLRSVHLAEVEHLNVTGTPGCACQAGIRVDGPGSPTGHTFENIRAFHFHTAIYIKSDTEHGRVEGVKVHNCNLVAVAYGIRAESVLELSAMQNHINCSEAGIWAEDTDQSFFIGNLIYHNKTGGYGILLKGASRPCTSNTIVNNVVNCVQGSDACKAVHLEGAHAGAMVSGNTFCKAHVGVSGVCESGTFGHVVVGENIFRACGVDCDVPALSKKHPGGGHRAGAVAEAAVGAAAGPDMDVSGSNAALAQDHSGTDTDRGVQERGHGRPHGRPGHGKPPKGRKHGRKKSNFAAARIIFKKLMRFVRMMR